MHHFAAAQLSTILASTYRATSSSRSNGCSISCLTIYSAYTALSYGPYKISSSWICRINFQPRSVSLWFLEMLTMAAMTMSAAPPWIGVFIARLSRMPLSRPFLLYGPSKSLSNFLNRPSKVCVYFFFSAISCFISCHFLT